MDITGQDGGMAGAMDAGGTGRSVFRAPVSGRVVPLAEVPDPVFNAGMLGPGCGIWPEENYLRAPYDGVVSSVSSTNHGIVLTSDDGLQSIVHVGVDTCEMQGKGFARLVEKGQRFRQGDPLMRFSIEAIRLAGYSEIVICVILAAERFRAVELVGGPDTVKAGEPLLEAIR